MGLYRQPKSLRTLHKRHRHIPEWLAYLFFLFVVLAFLYLNYHILHPQ